MQIPQTPAVGRPLALPSLAGNFPLDKPFGRVHCQIIGWRRTAPPFQK